MIDSLDMGYMLYSCNNAPDLGGRLVGGTGHIDVAAGVTSLVIAQGGRSTRWLARGRRSAEGARSSVVRRTGEAHLTVAVAALQVLMLMVSIRG
uniref:RE53348p n=1 Tax=Drosophila melanogaster TaxID=7227 RepID=Q8SYM3_DROME|nr:RE53348p [Drosophila melanogaster]